MGKLKVTASVQTKVRNSYNPEAEARMRIVSISEIVVITQAEIDTFGFLPSLRRKVKALARKAVEKDGWIVVASTIQRNVWDNIND